MVLTAGYLINRYLINRMPFSVLSSQVSHSVLFPKEPLYVVPPCVFGFTCFVHDFSFEFG